MLLPTTINGLVFRGIIAATVAIALFGLIGFGLLREKRRLLPGDLMAWSIVSGVQALAAFAVISSGIIGRAPAQCFKELLITSAIIEVLGLGVFASAKSQ